MKDVVYSSTGSSQTIGNSGCGPATAAMVVAQWRDKTVTPKTLAEYALNNGFRTVNSGTSLGFFTAISHKYSLNLAKTYSTDDVVDALKKGALVIASMGKGYWTNGGHYILLYQVQGDYIYAHDPLSIVRVKATISSFKKEANIYFIFTNYFIFSLLGFIFN